LTLFLISCKKIQKAEESKANINIPDILLKYAVKYESDKKNNDVVFMNYDASWIKNETPNIYISGSFLNKPNGELIKNPYFSINNKLIPFNGSYNFPGYFFQSQGESKDNVNWFKNLWGSKVNLQLKNIGIVSAKGETEDEAFYVPEDIQLETPINDTYVLNPTTSNTINWVPDPLNPIQNVYFGIIYEGDLAVQFDPNLPSGNSLVMFIELPDTGSFTLTPDLIPYLPVGGRASLFIARTNYETYVDPATNYETLVSAFSYSTTGPIGIQW
jgi:hypothetical protein